MTHSTRLRRLFLTRALTTVLAASVFALAHAVLDHVRAQEKTAEGTARSVWDGVFTEAQAKRGQSLYASHCARCHGADLQGGENRALAGDRFWTTWQATTVDRLLGYVSTNMPFSDDGSLKGALGMAAYADITAHILSANQFPPGSVELTAASGVGVRIIRQGGSGELPSGSFVHVIGCLARGSDRTWRLLRSSPPARVTDEQDVKLDAPLGDREYVLKFVLTSLEKFVGHRMSVRASLMGEGGVDGLNVTSTRSLSETCQ